MPFPFCHSSFLLNTFQVPEDRLEVHRNLLAMPEGAGSDQLQQRSPPFPSTQTPEQFVLMHPLLAHASQSQTEWRYEFSCPCLFWLYLYQAELGA